jgi:DNA replication factor GINS
MYNELYETWKRELENAELEKLPSDFYAQIADYLRRLREEGRLLDKRTVKASLLNRETRNVKRMVHEIVQARYKKLAKKAARGEKISSGVLAAEEEKIYTQALPFAESFQSFARDIVRGRVSKIEFQQEPKRTVLRFLKDVPAIIGADMKTYGPFKVEDVASMPTENAKIMVKQRLAEKVEIN